MSEEVIIAEEAKRYKDEWLLFEVTEVSDVTIPVKGRLLHHCRSRSEVQREDMMKYRELHTYRFFTGPLVPPGAVAMLSPFVVARKDSARTGSGEKPGRSGE